MRWEDERYVRLYTRDTVDWNMWPWQSRALFPLLLRKVDRAGIMELGRHGVRGLADAVKMPPEVVEPGLAGLLEDGCVEQRGTALVMRSFIEAQEAILSDAQRKRDQRERDRARKQLDKPDTQRDARSRPVTEGHAESRSVTSGHSDPIRAEPSEPSEPTRTQSDARAHVEAKFDMRRLQDYWTAKTGLIIAEGLVEIQVRLEQLGHARKVDPTSLIEPAVDAFVAFVESCTPGRRPPKSPHKFAQHWDAVQEIMNGTRNPRVSAPAPRVAEPMAPAPQSGAQKL